MYRFINLTQGEYDDGNAKAHIEGPSSEPLRVPCMERGNAGDWCLIGIRAEAEYSVGTSRNGYLAQEITSGGLWGIESDSEESYLKSVEDEELTDLSVQLKGIGFSGRAIAAAFKNVEREGC